MHFLRPFFYLHPGQYPTAIAFSPKLSKTMTPTASVFDDELHVTPVLQAYDDDEDDDDDLDDDYDDLDDDDFDDYDDEDLDDEEY